MLKIIHKPPEQLIREADTHWNALAFDQKSLLHLRWSEYRNLMQRDRADHWQCARWAADYLTLTTGDVHFRPYEPTTKTKAKPATRKSRYSPAEDERQHGDD